jgi:hypothetical protein
MINKYANLIDDNNDQVINQATIKLKKRVKILTTISLIINMVLTLLN